MRAFGGQAFLVGAVLLTAIGLVTALFLFLVERDVNPHIADLPSALGWAGRTVISGSPWDAVTPAGRGAQVVMLLLRPGLFGLVTAGVTTRLMQFVQKRQAGLGRPRVKDHIVLCGWSSKGHEIVAEIRGRESDEMPDVVVLAELERNPSADEAVRFVRGDPTRADDLQRAGIGSARTAIVLADNSYPGVDAEDMDSRSLLSVLAIESLNPGCYTCVEIVKSQNREHFERTRANELLVSGRLTGALLAHSAVTHGLSRIVGDLLTFPEGNEFYWVAARGRFVGCTFGEVLARLKQEADCIPLAISHGSGGYVINPPGDLLLTEGDRLLVIAQHEPQLN